ncbi:MAG: HepT-like ribonuclease domain-containing protein [Gemmatimonadales bacterium]
MRDPSERLRDMLEAIRNILVHGYFDIDTDIVWDAASRDVPPLKPAVETLLRALEERRG